MATATTRLRRGLVVGKFCPLHKGHEFLIGRALAACEQLTILSYTKPEFDACGRAAREGWLAARFPQATVLVLDDGVLRALCVQRGLPPVVLPHNDASDDDHRRFVAWLLLDVLGHTVDAVFTSEDYGDGFAAVLTDCFRARLGAHAAVEHVCVDRWRQAVPVSGTAVRADPHAHRDFLAPAVYAGFVKRVVLLGGESSGKTTLARALAERLGTAWVPEYGRELWERRDGRLCYDDMPAIAQAQVAREEAGAREAAGWLVCDTSPLTTLFYSHALFGRADPALAALAERRYDLTVLCAPDFPFVQDGTRQDDAFRARQHDWYVAALRERGCAYVVVQGDVGERVDMVVRQLHDIGSPPSREVIPGNAENSVEKGRRA